MTVGAGAPVGEGASGHDGRPSGAFVWVCRIAFSLVFITNVVCALQFVCMPDAYAGVFQLEGVSGAAAVRGLGVAFLMWNATYPFFIWRPCRYAVVGVIVLVQQLIGCAGETCILVGLPEGYGLLASSIERFILFDAAGLALMTLAFVLLMMRARGMRRPGHSTPSS